MCHCYESYIIIIRIDNSGTRVVKILRSLPLTRLLPLDDKKRLPLTRLLPLDDKKRLPLTRSLPPDDRGGVIAMKVNASSLS